MDGPPEPVVKILGSSLFVKYLDTMRHKPGWVYENRPESRVGAPDADVLRRAVSDDPEEALAALGKLRSFIEQASLGAVHDARSRSLSWARIGELLGYTKQAVWSRYAGYDPLGGRIEDED